MLKNDEGCVNLAQSIDYRRMTVIGGRIRSSMKSDIGACDDDSIAEQVMARKHGYFLN